MRIAKVMWTAVSWSLGLGPLSLMAHGLPSHASKWLIGTHVERERGTLQQQGDGAAWRRPTAPQIE
jgi:hypothetical protein